MSNPFKNHSIGAIEQCLATALSELYGEQISVSIGGLELNGFLGDAAKFTVQAEPGRKAFETFLEGA